AAASRSPRPRRARSASPEAAMNSPQTLRRGKRAFSSTITRHPARARRSAAQAPAGPPPMTSASARRDAGDEDMAEEAGLALLQPPPLAARPGARELAADEARAHARHGIVPR